MKHLIAGRRCARWRGLADKFCLEDSCSGRCSGASDLLWRRRGRLCKFTACCCGALLHVFSQIPPARSFIAGKRDEDKVALWLCEQIKSLEAVNLYRCWEKERKCSELLPSSSFRAHDLLRLFLNEKKTNSQNMSTVVIEVKEAKLQEPSRSSALCFCALRCNLKH